MPRTKLMAALAVALLTAAAGRADDKGEQVVAKVREWGGTVERDETLPGKPVAAITLPRAFGDARYIKALTALPELRKLRVEGGLLSEMVPALATLDGLEELTLNGAKFVEFVLPDLSALKKLKKLKKLSLTDPDTIETFKWGKAFAVFAEFESLEVLDMSRVNMSMGRDTLEPLKKFKNLRELILANTDLPSVELKSLAGLTELRVLDLTGVKLGDEEVKLLKGLKNLERLELRGSDATGAGLGAFPKLRRLSLSDFEPEGLKEVTAIPGLEHLSLVPPQKSIGVRRADDLRPLMGAKTLRWLDLSGLALDEKVFGLLKDLPTLEELDLSLTQAAEKDPGALDGFKALKVLRAAAICNPTGPNIVFAETKVQPGVGDAALGRFAVLPTLEHLDLTGTAVTDAGLKPLAEHPKLRRLELDRTKVTDAGVKALAALPALRRLGLSGTAVTDDGLAALKEAPVLDELDVSRTKVTDAGMTAVGAMARLVDLDLSGTAVTDDGLAALTDLQKLRALALRDLKLSLKALPHLAKLKELRTVYGANRIDFYPYDEKERANRPAIPGLRVIR
jgi:internalin A